MSETTLPCKVVVEVWTRSGGRCAYPGCNKLLWRDDLTMAKMNRAYLAHIIADRPGGPRGDSVLSNQLKKEPTNIMLMCDDCHRRIDREDVAGHPVELLHEYKRIHEERIEMQTGVHLHLRTHILLLSTKIAERRGLVDYEQACRAVLPARYPADERGIRIDLSSVQVSERDPRFLALICEQIDRQIERYLSDGLGPTGKPINHLSIFAIAPIPALIYLGKRLGDTISMDVFQLHRNPSDWQWQEFDDAEFAYKTHPPDMVRLTETKIAVNLSLSDTIHLGPIEAALEESVPIYTLTIPRPRVDFLHAQEQLELFRKAWRDLLGNIRARHDTHYELHLFPAVPNAVAVEIGRLLLPKSDPRIVIWDFDKEQGGWIRTVTV